MRTQGWLYTQREMESIGGHWHQQIQSAHFEWCTRASKCLIVATHYLSQKHAEGRIFNCGLSGGTEPGLPSAPLEAASRLCSPVIFLVPQVLRGRRALGGGLGEKGNWRRREKTTNSLISHPLESSSFPLTCFIQQFFLFHLPLRVDRVNSEVSH